MVIRIFVFQKTNGCYDIPQLSAFDCLFDSDITLYTFIRELIYFRQNKNLTVEKLTVETTLRYIFSEELRKMNCFDFDI